MYHKSYPSNNRFGNNRGFKRFRRNNYQSRSVLAKSAISSDKYIKKEPIKIHKSEAVVIKNRFENFALNELIKRNILSHGYEIPTTIQDQAIPLIMQGKDVTGIANTGTGKTAAFLLPLIDKIIKDRSEKVLIITPTRELAVQIEDELRAFSTGLNMISLLCIGGASIGRQMAVLRQNPNIVIGTPGRLKDLLNRGSLNLSCYRNIVLDEVDRMVDIGFINDIRFIISLLPKIRQSLFFSATISQEVNLIIKSFVNNPVTVSVKNHETAGSIEQDIIKVKDGADKLEKLHALLLKQDEFNKVLVFGRTKWGVERLSKRLVAKGINAASIHGNKTLNQRLRVLTQFKNSHIQVLVATDVAARGLDIANVSHVINFDEPSSYTNYVHRIGRTGRAQKTGKALTFIG